MTTSFFGSPDLSARKNRRRISFISHDLASTLTLATPVGLHIVLMREELFFS